MELPDLMERLKIDLKGVEQDNADESFSGEEEIENYQNGEIDIERRSPPDFKYENCSEGYLIKDYGAADYFNFRRCSYGQLRVQHLYQRIIKNAEVILGDSIVPITLKGAKENENSFIVGCLMNKGGHHIESFHNLKGIELLIEPTVPDVTADFVKHCDQLGFEDVGQQEITLKGNIGEFKSLTGLAVGIYGTRLSDDEFMVEKVILPSLPPFIERPLLDEDVYVIFISGFNFFKDCPTMFRKLSWFSDLLNSEKYYNKVARMVMAGNNTVTKCDCLECTHKMFKGDDNTIALRAANYLRRYFPHIDIDVMPGDADLTGTLLPQQPMLKVFFESCDHPSEEELKKEDGFESCDHPYEEELEKEDDFESCDHPSEEELKREDDFESCDHPSEEELKEEDDFEADFAAMFERKIKLSTEHEEPDSDAEFIEQMKNLRVASQKDDIELLISNQEIDNQSSKDGDMIVNEDIVVNSHDNDNEAFQNIVSSPSTSENEYSTFFSPDTVSLSDDSNNSLEGSTNTTKIYQITSNEEYYTVVDNWLLNSVGPGLIRVLTPVTNPYCFKVMGIEIHGTSGQNVDSLRNVTKNRKSTIKLMRDIIETGTVIPTAPDYLDLFPFNRSYEKDPLALDRMPHIFFAGNQNDFASELADFGDNRKVKLIAIPKYEESHSIVSVNLKTLQASQIVVKRSNH